MAKFNLLIISVFIFVSACGKSSHKSEISLVPEPSLGQGIYRIKGDDLAGNLVWSPKGENLAGLIQVLPYPDFCLGCDNPHSEIFIIDLENYRRRSILRYEYNEKYIQNIFWFIDGLHIGYTLASDSEDQRGTWSIDLQGQNQIQVLTEDEVPVWNPNGTKKALADSEKIGSDWYPIIYIVDTSTNQIDEVFRAKEQNVHLYGLSWSADGKILAFSYGDPGSDLPDLRPKIFFLDIETNKITQITNEPFEHFMYPEFSPKYNLIAYERYQPAFSKRTTVLKDISGKCELELPGDLNGSVSWSPNGQKLVVWGSGNYYIVDLSEFIGPKLIDTGSICT